MSAAAALGPKLAQHLAESPQRLLTLQLDPRLDGFAWEALDLGGSALGAHVAVGRQLLTDEPAPECLAAPLVPLLAAVHLQNQSGASLAMTQGLAFANRRESAHRERIATAHVLVIDEALPSHLLEQAAHEWGTPPMEQLLVVSAKSSSKALHSCLSQGFCVLVLQACPGAEAAHSKGAFTGDANLPPFEQLAALALAQLAAGANLGQTCRWLNNHARAGLVCARLYGTPASCFVQTQALATRRQVTTLVYDMAGSTQLMHSRGVEDYAELLARVHTTCRQIVLRHGGLPEEAPNNDGMVCHFGYPRALENAAVHAVQAGLSIAQSVAQLGASVRVGVATGLLAIKGEQAVGLSVHLAARIQQKAELGTVVLSESTVRLVQGHFQCQALEGQHSFKGIQQAQALWQVVGSHASHPNEPISPKASQAVSSLVGREAELSRLHACWRHTRSGQNRVALVRAEAGMGKTRLVREFRRQLTGAGVRVLECRCWPEATSSPFMSLAQALRRWLGIGPEEPEAQALAKLRSALPVATPQAEFLALQAMVLGSSAKPAQAAQAVNGLAAAPPGTASPAVNARQRLMQALINWFNTAAGQSPCCLVVEDWHWVDPSMQEFVQLLLESGRGPGLLMVLTQRTQAGVPLQANPPVPPFNSYEPIDLVGLSPQAAQALVEQICPPSVASASLVRQLVERGDGVPLFLEEAAQMAKLAKQASTDDALPGHSGVTAVPTTLQDLLTARLDALGSAKASAQMAAVLGREFRQELLAALIEVGSSFAQPGNLLAHLQTMVRSGLVLAQGPGEYAFKHALIRDAAYTSLWERDRQALHGHVVQLLRTRWAELGKQRPELMAQHLAQAGLHQEALQQWELAARVAADRSAELEAIGHLRQAMAALERTAPSPMRNQTALRLQLLLASRLLATQGYGAQSVLNAYLQAQRLCNQLGTAQANEAARFKVEMGLEAYRFMRADFGLALEHGQNAAQMAQRSADPKQRLQAHWGLACTLFHQGNLRATMREMQAGLDLYEPTMHRQFGAQDPGIMCMAYSAWGLWELGRPDEAMARINEACSIAARFEHKFSQAVALAYGASIELLRGETVPALARAQHCMQVCEEGGYPVWLAIARCMHGYLLCQQGQFEQGLPQMRAGYEQWLATGAMVSRPLYLALQAQGLMLAGQWAKAGECVHEGLQVVQRFGERQLHAELLRLHGELALQNGQRQEAEHSLKSSYAVAMRQRRYAFALRSATSLASLWAKQGQSHRALRLLKPLLARWSQGLQTADVQRAAVTCQEVESVTQFEARRLTAKIHRLY